MNEEERVERKSQAMDCSGQSKAEGEKKVRKMKLRWRGGEESKSEAPQIWGKYRPGFRHTRNCVGRYKHKYRCKAAEKNRAEKETRLNTAWLNFKKVTRTVDPPSRRQRPSSA